MHTKKITYYLSVYLHLLGIPGPSILRIIIKRIAREGIEEVIFIVCGLRQNRRIQQIEINNAFCKLLAQVGANSTPRETHGKSHLVLNLS